MQGLKGIFNRQAEQMKLHREMNAQAHTELENDKRRYEADEARAKNDLALALTEKKELARILQDLEDQCEQREKENERLRVQFSRLREDMVLLRPGDSTGA